MITRKMIQREQAIKAIENGEFDKEMLNSKPRVVVILTQDWCSQWHDMKSWIYKLDLQEEVDVYELEYNKVDYLNEFRNFKESTLNNHYIPYLRFYREGVLYRETNYISEGQFKEVLSI